jgi:hypothetical protein
MTSVRDRSHGLVSCRFQNVFDHDLSWVPRVDEWQVTVNEFLNGRPDGTWSTPAFCLRVFIFTVISLNVLAVLIESVPEIDCAVGNQNGNFFDRFEAFNQNGNFFDRFEALSVSVFAIEYMLRLCYALQSTYSTVQRHRISFE